MKKEIEEEKKALDTQYRARAQEMKKDCQQRLSDLEAAYRILCVCLVMVYFNK